MFSISADTRAKLRDEWGWTRERVKYPDLHYRYSHDISHVLILHLFGATAREGKVGWSPKVFIPTLLVTLSPIGLAAVLLRLSPPLDPMALSAHVVWIVYFVMLIYVAAGFAYGGVKVFHDLTASLEDVLTPDGREAYERWADISTAFPTQALVGGLVGVGACVALWLTEQSTTVLSSLHVSAASYLALLISGFFIGCAGYWVIAGSVLSIPITKYGRMRPSPYAPLSTPGIEMLVRCYRIAFYGASIGVSLCLFPILQWSNNGSGSQTFTIVKIGLFALCLAAVAAISLLPQWRLTRLLAKQRRDTFAAIVSALPADPRTLGDAPDPKHAYLLTWLQTLSSSRVSTVSESAFTGVVLGLATALIPLAIQLVLK